MGIFALNDDVFTDGNQNPEKYSADLPTFNFVSDSNTMCKEVRFDKAKVDDGASKSVVKSDVEGTSETQFTVITNNQSTGAETAGTTRSSIAKEQHPHSEDTQLQGK